MSDRFIEKDVLIVMELISSGFSRKSIIKNFTEKYNYSRYKINNLIKKAKAELAEEASIIKEELVAINNERLDNIYEKVYKEGEYKNALSTIDLQNKMNGIYDREETKETTTNIKIKFGE